MRRFWLLASIVIAGAGTAWPARGFALQAQTPAEPAGEWRYIGGDAHHTRYSALDQITAANFETLEVAWTWRSDNFGPQADHIFRSTPIYVDGLLYTVAGQRRTVAAIDPGTGETLWVYREPHTTRFDRGMRNNYGKGVAYGEIDGRRVIYYTSPAFFLHALDAKTGKHIENWGTRVPLPNFPSSGVVDMLPDLVRDWQPWLTSGLKYDPDKGIPRELGNLSTSSPPIVVNGVVIVGNVHEQGYYQTRIQNIPGDILAYDAKSGKHVWKFHVIPRPGEFGHETWENDAWQRTGDVSSWAPMSADPARGLVYIPTNPPTIDFFGGFRPGDNLFGTSILALDVKTGKRMWHFQTVHHDIWNFDNPTAPVLMDVAIAGRRTPIVVQTTKQGFAYTFNRETGAPIWPIVERPVAASDLPGEKLSPTQPFPTRPKAFEIQELTVDNLIDFTPELRQEAMATIKNYKTGPLFTPPIQVGHPSGLRSFVSCPAGASNINGPTVADPESGVLFVTSQRLCRAENVVPGEKMDEPNDPKTTGQTLSRWVVANRGDLRGPDGLPIWKPPYSRIIAIDMATGEFLWEKPNGDTPEHIRNHPRLRGLNIPATGQTTHAVMMPTRTLLLTAPGGDPVLYALDKRTGERVGTVKLPAPGQYGMMGYLHGGRQYVVVQVASGTLPGSLVALRLPDSQRSSRPSLDGIWNSATTTPIERPVELKAKPFFTPAEAAAWDRRYAENTAEPTPAAAAKQKGTGTYNGFYREWGTRTVKTLRTSIITEPADGRIPALTPAAADVKRRRLEDLKKFENPENLGLQDRCLAFLTAGPPMLPYSYNSNYQIVQTLDAVLIHAEMIHEARIIHMDGRPHVSPRIRLAMGDSIGRWEGDALVIDTTNFDDGGGFYGDAGGNFGWDRHLHLVERLRLIDADTLLYQFEIDNPTAFTRPWKGELTMTRSDGPIYEFACHEGNYSLTNMLRGQRATERKPR